MDPKETRTTVPIDREHVRAFLPGIPVYLNPAIPPDELLVLKGEGVAFVKGEEELEKLAALLHNVGRGYAVSSDPPEPTAH